MISYNASVYLKGVYTKNRNFRLFLSSKLRKKVPLVIAKENQFLVRFPQFLDESAAISNYMCLTHPCHVELVCRKFTSAEKEPSIQHAHGLHDLQRQVILG